MKCRTCFVTLISLVKGIKSEFFCRVFADLKSANINKKSIYMSAYLSDSYSLSCFPTKR